MDTIYCIENLPFEVLTMIFVRVRLCDLCNVARTCKKFREVVTNNKILWRKKGDETFLVTNSRNYTGASNTFSLSPYHQCRVSSNWRRGFFKDEVIAQSNIKYMPWLILRPDSLILSTGSVLNCYPRNRRGLPSSQSLWSVSVPTVRRSGVRTNDISRFVIKNKVIVCANRDGCISVLDIVEQECQCMTEKCSVIAHAVLREHIKDCHQQGNVEITAIDFTHNMNDIYCILSGSNDDQTIKFWKEGPVNSINEQFLTSKEQVKQRGSYYCTHSIRAPIEGARCMLLNASESKLVVGLKCNKRPLLIDVEMGEVIYNPVDYVNYSECVRDITWVDENVAAYVTHSGFLSIFDSRTCSIVKNICDPLTTSLYSLKSDGRHAIVTGCSQFSRCVLYDIRSTRCVQILFTQKCSSPVYSLDFDSCVLTAAAERGVAVLNFNINTTNVRKRDFASIVRTFR